MPDSLEDLDVGTARPDPAQPIRVEPSPRRVRAFFNHVAVADSRRVLLLLEQGHLPVYYFPAEDVRMDLLEPTKRSTRCPYKGNASYWTVRVGDRTAENAAWGYLDPLPERTDIKGHVAFYWNRMDAWYEEDDEVFVHPRDPYHRVDVVNSSRHVRVEIGGETVADTRRPRLLFETGLPTRYYIPKMDVRMDLLKPTDTVTACPYKGQARYWSAEVGQTTVKDVAWSYPAPIAESPKIEQLVAFFNERVDLYVDDELQPRPETMWS
ncbi:MAG TPA: DUF427 domain-containing protein [Actinomycetes bacterium]|jgi:uncharacterized protein (DUF427 family)|nr:DUF427 domain-containing protein [Actinomycetes bacterium]